MWSVQCHWSHSSGKLWSNCKCNFLWGDWAPKCSFYVLASPHASVSSVKNLALTQNGNETVSTLCRVESFSQNWVRAGFLWERFDFGGLARREDGNTATLQHCLARREDGDHSSFFHSCQDPGPSVAIRSPDCATIKRPKICFAMKYFTHQHYIDRSSTQEIQMVSFKGQL